jgi:hypothetical protein
MINIPPTVKPRLLQQQRLRRTNRVLKAGVRSISDNKDRRQRRDRRQCQVVIAKGQDRRSGAERRRHINIRV